ncbi:hypothetical protein BC830DRAFT_1079361 [Chytriomyces sp. MP71]|nr:hypothetical protein BC830DRAFT_1079361 [Chytriomyces sp. MP71]
MLARIGLTLMCLAQLSAAFPVAEHFKVARRQILARDASALASPANSTTSHQPYVVTIVVHEPPGSSSSLIYRYYHDWHNHDINWNHHNWNYNHVDWNNFNGYDYYVCHNHG